jgi:hypothetical protein
MAEEGHLASVMMFVPREEWASSNKVARAFLECTRVKGIIKHHGYQLKLQESQYQDLKQNAWMVLADRLPLLDSAENVYTYLYAIIRNSIFTIKNKNKDHKTEALQTEEEEADEEQHIKPIAEFDSGTLADHSDAVIKEIDRERAEINFKKKLWAYTWPSDIIRDPALYKRIGRPRKEEEP